MGAAAAIIPLILQGVQAAIAAAPTAIDIIVKAKALIASLFTAGLITKDQQDTTHAHLDSIQAMALSGLFPAWWQVQPTPVNVPVIPPGAPSVLAGQNPPPAPTLLPPPTAA